MKHLNYLKTLGLALVIIASACAKEDNDTPSTSMAKTESTVITYEGGESIVGQYIILLKGEFIKPHLNKSNNYEAEKTIINNIVSDILNSAGIEASIVFTYTRTILGVSINTSDPGLNKLLEHPYIKNIEQDKVVALGPKEGKGKPDKGNGGEPSPDPSPEPDPTTSTQVTPYGITRVGGFGNGFGKTAWIIDSGIDLKHPDLNVNTDKSASFVDARGKDGTPQDLNGHGTHVAGTIAAIDNTFGVVGVAAGASVVAVKVLNKYGAGSISGVIAGVDYVAATGRSGDAANMSLGGGASAALDESVLVAAQTGINFILASGNDSRDVSNQSPGRVNGPNIYTISAMDKYDLFAYFSNYGNGIDFCAPGVDINSTWTGGGYNTISGTSMATPHVTGIILLGAIKTDGYVRYDQDNTPDPIAYR